MSDMWREIVPDASADRYAGIIRPYAFEEVQKLRGSIEISHTLAHRGANRLWRLPARPGGRMNPKLTASFTL